MEILKASAMPRIQLWISFNYIAPSAGDGIGVTNDCGRYEKSTQPLPLRERRP
jgi:hypothetical protein